MANTFLYFAYGSNLLTKRILINNPTAKRYGNGMIKNYRLDFITYSNRWKGASATIVPTEGANVWGAIWEIDQSNMKHLDSQEGVDINLYFPHNVDVLSSSGEKLTCRTYQQTVKPNETYKTIEDLPKERKPSGVYLKTIQIGAQESKLPQHYIDFLHKIPDNGYIGEVDIGFDFKDVSI